MVKLNSKTATNINKEKDWGKQKEIQGAMLVIYLEFYVSYKKMKRIKTKKHNTMGMMHIVLGVFVFLLSSEFVMAEDPLDTRPSLMWLSEDVNVSVFGDNEYESFLGKSEFWSKNWGISAKLLQNNSDDVFGFPEDSKYFNLDVKRRFGGKDKSNFELGLGWQELDIDSQLEASGPRVSLSGRLNVLDSFQVYGLTSYFPELEDSLKNNDATAYEFEAGLLYKPLPSVSLKAGYRVFNLDLEDPNIQGLGSSSGFLLGTDLSW